MTVSREWYLAQTKVRQESVARQNLERQRYIVWLPQVYVWKARSECIEALFPGYLFIRLSPDTDDFGPIRSTVGVLRLVKFGTTFARVPDSWVGQIRAEADRNGVCKKVGEAFTPGDHVEIVGGVLTGYRALVTEYRGKARVALLLKVAGRHVSLVAPKVSIARVE